MVCRWRSRVARVGPRSGSASSSVAQRAGRSRPTTSPVTSPRAGHARHPRRGPAGRPRSAASTSSSSSDDGATILARGADHIARLDPGGTKISASVELKTDGLAYLPKVESTPGVRAGDRRPRRRHQHPRPHDASPRLRQGAAAAELGADRPDHRPGVRCRHPDLGAGRATTGGPGRLPGDRRRDRGLRELTQHHRHDAAAGHATADRLGAGREHGLRHRRDR